MENFSDFGSSRNSSRNSLFRPRNNSPKRLMTQNSGKNLFNTSSAFRQNHGWKTDRFGSLHSPPLNPTSSFRRTPLLDHRRSFSFANKPLSPRLAREAVIIPVKRQKSTSQQTVESGPYCTIEKPAPSFQRAKAPIKTRHESENETEEECYDYGVYQELPPEPSMPKSSVPPPPVPSVPPPKFDDINIPPNKVMSAETEKWPIPVFEQKMARGNLLTFVCLIIVVAAFVLLFAVLLTFWWSQYYMENKRTEQYYNLANAHYSISQTATFKSTSISPYKIELDEEKYSEAITGSQENEKPNIVSKNVNGKISAKQENKTLRNGKLGNIPMVIESDFLLELLDNHNAKNRIYILEAISGGERGSAPNNNTDGILYSQKFQVGRLVYDRHPQSIWATYAFWLFKIYGHEHISVLNGGLNSWNKLKEIKVIKNAEDTDPDANNLKPEQIGHYRASWDSSAIFTFDDVLQTCLNLNNETGIKDSFYDIVDAQTSEDYTGNSSLGTGKVVYGHIKGAINIPLEMLQRTSTNGSSTWVPLDEQAKMLIKMGLNPRRPVIVYDSTSVRSSAVWFALKRLSYDAGIYFGSWPEWIIKAPDALKITSSTTV